MSVELGGLQWATTSCWINGARLRGGMIGVAMEVNRFDVFLLAESQTLTDCTKFCTLTYKVEVQDDKCHVD